MNTKLGVIIVTYNSRNDIIRLLDSILIQGYNNLVVYIVDNNSSDDTLDLSKGYNTKLSIVVMDTGVNNGYAAGNNIGIRKAIDDGCDFVFILNPDMQLDTKCIEILIRKFELDEKIGVIGPVVLYGSEQNNLIQTYGVKTNFKTQKKSMLYSGKILNDEIPGELIVDYVLGGAMMIRSSVLIQAGLFEENYFMYNDEIDFAYRLKKAGFKTFCLSSAIVRHFHNFEKTNKRGNSLMYYYVMRNRYLYFKKFNLTSNLLLSLIIEIFEIPLTIRWAVSKMGGISFLRFYYAGLWDGLLGKKGIANRSFEID